MVMSKRWKCELSACRDTCSKDDRCHERTPSEGQHASCQIAVLKLAQLRRPEARTKIGAETW